MRPANDVKLKTSATIVNRFNNKYGFCARLKIIFLSKEGFPFLICGKSQLSGESACNSKRADKCLPFLSPLPLLCTFPGLFLGENPGRVQGTGERVPGRTLGMRQSPCLPVPCLFFPSKTTKTTEKANTIYSLANEERGTKGHLNKCLCNVAASSRLGEEAAVLRALGRDTDSITELEKAH